MKPRTKIQKQIVALSHTLPSITEAQKEWAFRHCFKHIAHRTAKGVCTCLECGHSWSGMELKDKVVCPHCGTELNVTDTRKRTFRQIEYFGIVTTCKGFQVLRFFYIQANYRKGNPAEYLCKEAVKRRITAEGKFETIALLRSMCFLYNDIWNFYSALEIRPNRNVYNIDPIGIYPRRLVIPQIKRNGFNGDFYECTPFDLFHSILTNSVSETLLKSGQINLMKLFIYAPHYSKEKYWASIKVCIRNGYSIEDASMWCDYIDLLYFFHKDIHNAKYVCPTDLKTEHDRLMAKKQQFLECERKARQEREQLEEAKRGEESAKLFTETKARFFGLKFSDGLIKIQMLESVQAFAAYHAIRNRTIFAHTLKGTCAYFKKVGQFLTSEPYLRFLCRHVFFLENILCNSVDFFGQILVNLMV
jgi:DNA-directed RNA polymerase subunit RPC12/RpoP